jgi:hypothetical protein
MEMEAEMILLSKVPTQIGGNFSRSMMVSYKMSKTIECWMFLEAEMKKETRFKHGRKMVPKPNLGTLCISLMLRRFKRKDSTKTVEFM